MPLADEFLALHVKGRPLLQPNAWDAGSARILASLGFPAIATTSSGFAASLGRSDGSVTLDELLVHCRALTDAVGVPVAADSENGFADQPSDVANNVRRLATTGLAGCSVEDFTRRRDDPIYDAGLATDRIAAAAEAAHAGAERLVLTARAENLLYGRDLADAISRLQAYAAAGADVLFAPGLRSADDIRAVVSSVDKPVNVLVVPGMPSIAELAEIGVARISVGGSFAWAAYGALVRAASELRDEGSYGYGTTAAETRSQISAAVS